MKNTIPYEVGQVLELDFMQHSDPKKFPLARTDDNIVCFIHSDDIKKGRKPQIGATYKCNVAMILENYARSP